MLTLFRCFLLVTLLAASLFGAEFKSGDAVEVLWSGRWYPAKIVAVEEGKWRISYDGYGSNWDESVGPERLRAVNVSESLASPTTNTRTTAAAPAAEVKPPVVDQTFPFPERPAGKTAGIQGAYLRVQSWYFNGRMSLTNEGWFFTKGGRLSLSPAGGFNFADFETRETARKSDGVYWIENDVLTIHWANGSKPTTHDFKVDKDGVLLIGGIAATRVDGFKRGWRVEAKYEGGASYRGGGSYLASSNSLNLNRDGTFGGGAIGSVSASFGGTSVGSGSSSSTAGTYEFDEHTLTLTHADGRVERLTVFAFSDKNADGAPAYIWREGTMLSRRDPPK